MRETRVTFLITFPKIWGCMCLLSVSKLRHARVSVQREGEVKRRDKRPERVHSTGAAGVGRCRSPRTQTVLSRGYRADLRRHGVGGLVGSRALNTICMHRPTLKGGGGRRTRALHRQLPPRPAAPRTTRPPPHHSALFISAHAFVPFIFPKLSY